MKLLITGASGRLGRASADRLLERTDPGDLILTTRDPGSLADYAARGVEVREADFERPETLPAAFAGADRVLLVSTDAIGRREAQHRAAIQAATDAGVTFIAYTSFPSFGPDDLLSAEHAATERQLRDSGLEWCILRNSAYADNEVDALRQAVASGELVSNTADGATSFVARDDCAAVAAAVLAGSGHAGRTYDVTGPEAIDAEGRARIFSEVSGRPIAVRHVDDETAARELSEAAGLPLPVALGMVGAIGRATRDGVFATVTDVVERLTGRPATPLRAVLEAASTTG